MYGYGSIRVGRCLSYLGGGSTTEGAGSIYRRQNRYQVWERMMFDFNILRQYLESMNVRPGTQLDLENYTCLLTLARDSFGEKLSACLMDCFTPEGQVVEPGYEDSLSHYLFDVGSWEELEEDFRTWEL